MLKKNTIRKAVSVLMLLVITVPMSGCIQGSHAKAYIRDAQGNEAGVEFGRDYPPNTVPPEDPEMGPPIPWGDLPPQCEPVAPPLTGSLNLLYLDFEMAAEGFTLTNKLDELDRIGYEATLPFELDAETAAELQETAGVTVVWTNGEDTVISFDGPAMDGLKAMKIAGALAINIDLADMPEGAVELAGAAADFAGEVVRVGLEGDYLSLNGVPVQRFSESGIE